MIVSYSDWIQSGYDFEQGHLLRDDSRYPYAKSFRLGVCRYCESTIQQVSKNIQKKPGYYPIYFDVNLCEFCGWWFRSRRTSGGQDTSSEDVISGIAKRYNISSVKVPLFDLRIFLSKHPDHVAHVNPFAFENLMYECLRERYGLNCDVIKIGGRKDKGIDVILVNASGEKTIVQIKRRKNISLSEGVTVVRLLNGVLFRENVAKGIVITTARRYTEDAKSEAKIDHMDTHEIELLRFDDVVDLIGVRNFANDYAPWENIDQG